MVQEVCYIDVDVWGPQAESCRQYLQKGRSVLVEGRLKLDNWQDADGNKRSKHSIVADRVTFLGAGAQADESEDATGPDAAYARAEAEAVKPATRSASKKAVEKSSVASGGELDFKDEAPFEDDLPF